MPGLINAVFAAELVNPATAVEDFLLAGVERMTGRTHFYEEILTQCGASNELIAAATGNLDFGVIGVNLGFHFRLSWGAAVRRAA
jgi:hypothetical protein